MTLTTDRPAAVVPPTLGDAIADELHALAELVRTTPRLAEEIRHSLNPLSVSVLGLNPAGAVGDICVAAQRAGATVVRNGRGLGCNADISFGRHVLVWLYTRNQGASS